MYQLVQPLPAWTSWYIDQAPAWFHLISLGFMWFAELVAPFLIFGPRKMRLRAFVLIVLLQLLIAATGNYGFFNLLALVLCVTLLDDAQIARKWRVKIAPEMLKKVKRWCGWPIWVTGPLAAVIAI